MAARIIRLRDFKGLSPAPDRFAPDSPPVAHGNGRLGADGAGQLLVHQQTRAAPCADGPAARPGDPSIGPTGDDHFGIAEEAEGTIALVEGGWFIGTMQESKSFRGSHGMQPDVVRPFKLTQCEESSV